MSKLRPKILIVDDNEVMRALMRGILRNEDYEIVGEAKNGIAALEMTALLCPDIICMDVEMPEMGGIEALQQIKKTHPATAVIMITGNASLDNVKEAIQCGACAFIVKPFNAAKVIDTLQHAYAGRRSLPA